MELYLHHRILDIYRNVDIFIAPSMFLKNKHEEMGFRKKIMHLPYPLDVKEFEKINSVVKDNRADQHINFVYFGRLEPEKGLYTLFDSIKILSDNQSKNRAVFNIVGDGPMKDELHTMARKNGMDNIKFLGFLKGEKLFAEIKKADVIIIPSEWYENYPVSVMEAFALGRPVIGRIGGIPEMVKDNKTGLTFESGNAAELTNKINYVLKNPGETVIWGRNARKFIENEVNPEKHYRELMTIYEMAISGKR